MFIFVVYASVCPGGEEDQDHRADRRSTTVGHPSWGHQPLHGHLPQDGGRLLRPLHLLLHLHPLSWDLVALRLRDSLTLKEPCYPSCCPLLLYRSIKASLSSAASGALLLSIVWRRIPRRLMLRVRPAGSFHSEDEDTVFWRGLCQMYYLFTFFPTIWWLNQHHFCTLARCRKT